MEVIAIIWKNVRIEGVATYPHATISVWDHILRVSECTEGGTRHEGHATITLGRCQVLKLTPFNIELSGWTTDHYAADPPPPPVTITAEF